MHHRPWHGALRFARRASRSPRRKPGSSFLLSALWLFVARLPARALDPGFRRDERRGVSALAVRCAKAPQGEGLGFAVIPALRVDLGTLPFGRRNRFAISGLKPSLFKGGKTRRPPLFLRDDLARGGAGFQALLRALRQFGRRRLRRRLFPALREKAADFADNPRFGGRLEPSLHAGFSRFVRIIRILKFRAKGVTRLRAFFFLRRASLSPVSRCVSQCQRAGQHAVVP